MPPVVPNNTCSPNQNYVRYTQIVELVSNWVEAVSTAYFLRQRAV